MFSEKWGWYMSIYELCGNDVNLKYSWLDANVMEFLNMLSYNKEKENMRNKPKMGKQY